jgi:uncharacterized damage-inducible protein DinB
MTAHELILSLLREAYDQPAWHGPNLHSALRGLTARQAAWSPGRGRPCIWQIALHTAFWKHRVRVRISGEGAAERFPRPGSDWPGMPANRTDAEWRKDLALLRRTHRELLEAAAGLAERQLHRPGPGQKRARIKHLIGIALHDTYHAGQIRLIRRLMERGR